MNLERGNVVRTFLEMVLIDSPTGKEESMANDAVRRLSELGLNPQVDKVGNVVAFLDGDPNKEPYFLNGHLDTAQGVTHIDPKIDNDGWIRPKGKTILGADNKTAVAAIIETVTKLVKEKSTSHHPLDIVLTVSEESKNLGSIGLDYRRLKSKRGFSFDGGSDRQGDIVISSPFYERFDFLLIGKSGHAGHPEAAINVLPATAKAILNSPFGQVDERTVANIAYVSLGSVNDNGLPIVNTIPGKVLISGEVRSTDENTLVKTRNAILSAFIKNAEEGGLSMEKIERHQKFYIRENPGFVYSTDDSFVQHTSGVLRTLGFDPQFIKSMGCFDANLFFQNGVQVVNIADGSLDHHSEGNERVSVADLEKLQEIIYKLVTE